MHFYVNGRKSGALEYNLPRRGLLQKWYGDLTTGYAKPCVTGACLKVRIHDKGAEQIKKIFEDKINFKNDPDETNYDYHDPMKGTGYLGIPYWDTNSYLGIGLLMIRVIPGVFNLLTII